jgi:integrase
MNEKFAESNCGDKQCISGALLVFAKGKWQRRLQRLFGLANVPTGHAHRLRDTFAVELLLAGVPLDRVSVLLGHSSIRITERHYAPWTRSRQEQIEADLKAAWSNDPVVLTDGKGAPEVQEKTGPIN